MQTPKNLIIHNDTLKRSGDSGDNFWTTWAADDNQYTTQDDGWGWGEPDDCYQSHIWRIEGGPDDFEVSDVPSYPFYPFAHPYNDRATVTGYGFFAYGIVSVDGVLYVTASKTRHQMWSGPMQGTRMLASRDMGETWHNVDREGNWVRCTKDPGGIWNHERAGLFFDHEGGRYCHGETGFPFAFITVAQCGKDYQAAQDDYVYFYSPEGSAVHQLLLARAPRDRIGQRASWEFFTHYDVNGEPEWSPNLHERGIAHIFPEKHGDDWYSWYSWQPSVVYNEGLGCYIMATHGTYTPSLKTDTYYDKYEHTKTGSLMFLWSDKPYGPWKQFYYNPYWNADGDEWSRTYQTTLSQKWIYDGGRSMYLIFSDAHPRYPGESREPRLNYLWNQVKVEVEVE